MRSITYAVDYQFSGLNPFGYHISNIILHILTSLLIYLTISALSGNSRIAFFAALLFAVHPVHTDSVAYISGRRDILSTLFYILGFYLFLESRKKKKSKFLILSLAAYLLAIASKEMAVTLPAIFFAYDFISSLPDEGSLANRLSNALKKIISSYKIFYLTFLVPAILFTCYKVLLKSPSNKEGFYGGDLYIQFLTVSKILFYYIKLLFFPINLIADYSFNSFPLSQSLLEPETIFSLMALCAIALLTLRLLFKNKLMAFSLIWFFVTLLPVCHIFPHHELLAEHYLYLPSFGFVLLIALSLELLLTSARWRYYIYISFTLAIILFSTRTFYRNYDWKNSYTIWKKTVKTVPNCVRAVNNLGVEYFKRKDLKQAKNLHQKALKIQPAYEKAYYNLGNVYRTEQNFNRAIEMYKKAAQLNPKNFRAYNNLGNAYAMQKRYDEAKKEYKSVLKLKPRYAEAHNNLGNVYRSLGKTDLAIAHYRGAIKIKARYFDAYFNLSNVYAERKQYEKSIETLKQALGKNPFFPSTYNHLGKIYIKTEQYGKAIEMYEYAIKLKPNDPEPYLNLGNLYLKKLNDKQNALLYFKKWLEKAPRHPASDKVRQIIHKLEKEGGG